MNWKQRQKEIERLRDQFGRGKDRKSPVVFPDLKCPTGAAPLSNVIAIPGGRTPVKEPPADAKQFPVGHSHKQGLQMITPGTPLKDMSGSKT